MKCFDFLKQFFLISFLAVGLSACPESMIKKDLSPLQDAYQVRDSIIIAKKGLNDALDLGKISKSSYDTAWKSVEDADKIIVAQIRAMRQGVVDATKKLDEAKAIGGVK